ncbi:restriction endonuclease subunit S [Acinetobacter tjernbergiae]|uniref:Type I restriction modification DNA specificity domain-containing protein n=1 Tax=Acinetobacter tjernbergiae DSM 14971 = CIP 107465 TaxID=1120928 RepID=V2V8A8_9GAMM|nr:restriction endonuclease subunit S [Acinetobacter tjernbergiae]ESK57111.1 hypothetical protein F990_00585 [Acinetobacter tjernbergiae DSM 14971 = CIP 107465]
MSFELTTLGEYISIQGGYAYKSQQFIENSTYPVLKIKNIRTGYVDINDCAYIDKNSADETERYIVSEGDVLISLTGSGPNAPQSLVGRVARFWDKGKRAWINQRVGRVVLKKDKTVHKDFIFYFLGTKESQNYLVANSSGSANQANINGAIIEALPFPRIDYSTSKKISKVLRTLDEKINLNNQINQTLESIAQAIFKSWFIDFEPVRAKIAAKQTGQDPERAAMCAISGKSEAELKQMEKEDFAELQAMAALFPDELVESELGEVPRGWEYKKLKDICKVLNGRAYKNTEFKEEGIPIVRIQNLTGGGKTVFSDLDLPQDKLIEKEDFIYAWSATFGPYIWRGPKSIYHYHIWKMDVDETIISRYFLYLTMFRKTESMKSAGTGSIFTHLTKVIMESQDVLIADNAINMLFKDRIDKIFKLISLKSDEIKNLENIRDTLLPKLLSGEVDVTTLADTKNSSDKEQIA